MIHTHNFQTDRSLRLILTKVNQFNLSIARPSDREKRQRSRSRRQKKQRSNLFPTFQIPERRTPSVTNNLMAFAC